ncbi:hypothetical protein D3C72_926900 [compost metagenome]
MSKKATREKEKPSQRKGAKLDIRFNKMSPTEVAEFTARRAAGEDESAIVADFRRRKRA